MTVGVLNPLYDLVAWIIVQFHALYSHVFASGSGPAWGLSIVSLVVVIRIALIPLFVKQIKSTRNMQALQPRIKEIQAKYKNDRERQSQELMKLYKETGTNPLSSCLPIIAQAPFFISLYHVLNGIAHDRATGPLDKELVKSAFHAKIFGAPISSSFTHPNGHTTVQVVTIIMILLMSLSQFITQRQLMLKNMTPEQADNPFVKQQKLLMYVFPVMFAVFGINFPVGVLVYWLTTNVWTMGQQLYVIRRMPTPGSPAHEELEKRRAAKGTAPKDGAKAGSADTGSSAGNGGGPAPAVAPAPAEVTVKRQQPKRKPRSKRTGPAKPRK
jgi:YidC/Oxa1 family membrane protein insertase